MERQIRCIERGIAFWCTNLPQDERVGLEAQWKALHRIEAAELASRGRSADAETNASLIFALLGRISRTPYTDAYRDTAVALVQAAVTDDAFRASCGAEALVGNGECHDNAIGRFEALRLELSFRAATSIEACVAAAPASAATDLLSEIAATKFPRRSEALEVFQWLKCQHWPRWSLPDSHMEHDEFAIRYMGGRDKAAEMKRESAEYVEEHLPDQIPETLMKVPRWQTLLKEHYRQELEACLGAVYEALEKVMASAEPTARTDPRINGLNNIYANAESIALQRLTQLLVQAFRESESDNRGVDDRVFDRLRDPGHARDIEALVRARLAADAEFQRISEEATAQAEQWEQPTLFLAERNWGRRMGGHVNPGRVEDPMGDRFRMQQREAEASAAAAAPGSVADLQFDPEALDLQRALERSLRDAPRRSPGEPVNVRASTTPGVQAPGGVIRNAGLARALQALDQGLLLQASDDATADASLGDVIRNLDAAVQRLPDEDRARAFGHAVPATVAPATDGDLRRAGAVAQALETLRGDRRQVPPGVDRIALAHREIRQNIRPSTVPDPSYMVNASVLRGLLKRTEGIVDVADRTLAMHGDAALLDVIRERLRSSFRSSEAVLAALSGRDGPGTRTPLQILARLIEYRTTDPALRISQARLVASTVDLLRQLAASLAQTASGAWSDGQGRVLAAVSGDGRLFAHPLSRAITSPSGVLALRLQASGFDPVRPRVNLLQVMRLEAEAEGRIGDIADPALRQAYRWTRGLADTRERLERLILDHARRASDPP